MPTPSSSLNISPGAATDTSFAPITSSGAVIGPVAPDAPSGGDTIVSPNGSVLPVNPTPPQQIYSWTVMDKFDDGLRKALINFINTTKEGQILAPTSGGRTKKMDFYFKGTPSIDLKPGEIGSFSVVFSYPPGANSTAVNTVAGEATSAPVNTTNNLTSLG